MAGLVAVFFWTKGNAILSFSSVKFFPMKLVMIVLGMILTIPVSKVKKLLTRPLAFMQDEKSIDSTISQMCLSTNESMKVKV